MPFVKGKSGNPGGRPKALVNVQEWARTTFDDVGKARLMDLLRSKNEKVVAEGIKILLDRGYGRPRQDVDVSMDVNFSSIVGEMVRELDIEINK